MFRATGSRPFNLSASSLELSDTLGARYLHREALERVGPPTLFASAKLTGELCS